MEQWGIDNIKRFVSIADLTKDDLQAMLDLLPRTKVNFNKSKPANGYILANLFFEPSTRTRLSFESAMLRLGGSTMGFSDGSNSSVSKGESRMDTALTVSNYCDIMVVRDSIPFSPLEMATVATIPIINAGDGTNEHPTQTLTDVFTIHERFDRLDGLTIGLVGDLKNGRTTHSLLQFMARWPDNQFILVSSPELQMPDEFIPANVQLTKASCLDDVIEHMDVCYMTRVQKERFENPDDYKRLKGSYKLTPNSMSLAKEDMIIMHPLPRVDEIDMTIDRDPRAWYFKQVKCGVWARMALIHHMLDL